MRTPDNRAGTADISSETQAQVLSKRPDIFAYLDYRAYLRDLVANLKENSQEFSLRALAKQINVSPAYLSMVFSGHRSLSAANLENLAGALGLEVSEKSYLEWLLEIGEAKSDEDVLRALKKIQRFQGYRDVNAREIEVYEYLTHWQNVAIREMTALPDFQPDPKWIQKRLKNKVALKDIRESLDFLEKHGFIERDPDGKIQRPSKRIAGKTGVLKPALTKFHRDLLLQAVESLESTPSEERNISAHTAAIPKDKVAEAKRILDEAREKIFALTGDETPGNSEVYHFNFIAFPLTNKIEEEE